MKITDTQMVSYMLDTKMSTNDLVAYLQVVEKLIKRYGRMVFSDVFQSEIKSIQPEIVYLLQALSSANKTKVQTIKHIVSLVKKQATDYHKEFVVKAETDEHYQQVKKFLDQKFVSSNIEKHVTKGNSVRISGEGRYYKRGLEQDVQKLLGL